MISLFKRKIDQSALLAVCPTEDAINFARVRRSTDSSPVLELCDFEAVDNLGIQGAEISRLCKINSFDQHYCITILDTVAYSLLLVEAPDVPATELRSAIRWRVKDLIDFHIDDAVIDVFDVPNQRMTGNKKMMYAVVAKSSYVKQQVDLMTGSDLNLEVIDIPELAIRNIAALLPEDVAGVVVLYLDRNTGLITITRQATLYLSRRIDLGYESLGTSLDSAMPRLDKIVVEIQRSMDYYESNFSQPGVTNVVIAPMPHHITGIEDYLSQHLGISFRTLDLNTLIDMEEPIDNMVQSKCMMAIGAALREEGKIL